MRANSVNWGGRVGGQTGWTDGVHDGADAPGEKNRVECDHLSTLLQPPSTSTTLHTSPPPLHPYVLTSPSPLHLHPYAYDLFTDRFNTPQEYGCHYRGNHTIGRSNRAVSRMGGGRQAPVADGRSHVIVIFRSPSRTITPRAAGFGEGSAARGAGQPIRTDDVLGRVLPAVPG